MAYVHNYRNNQCKVAIILNAWYDAGQKSKMGLCIGNKMKNKTKLIWPNNQHLGFVLKKNLSTSP